MGNDPSLESLLLKSEAVASLRAEQEVAAAFKRLAWWTVDHGPFYRDPETAKLRELDVRASRQWLQNGADSPTVTLEVLVELKSMKGFHVIFAPSVREIEASRPQLAWAGHYSGKLRECLSELGLSADSISRALTLFSEKAYPDGEIIHGRLDREPSPCAVLATAFRESNIGNAKDLDNSVLWRAVQGLTAAMDASRQRVERLLVADIPTHVEMATDADDLMAHLGQSFAGRLSMSTLFHPVVVTDARLWVSTEKGLQSVTHVRFVPQNSEPWPPAPWFDVVTRESFGVWVDALTEHYRTRLEHPAEARIRSSGQALQQAFEAIMEVVADPALDLNITVRDRNRGSIRRIRIRREHGAPT